MSSMQAEVFEAFRDMGAAEDKALRAASVLGKSRDEIAALRTDMNKAFLDLRTDMNKGFAKVDVEIVAIKGELILMRRMGGLILAMLTTLLFRAFTP